jgi:nucleoside-diphosphate kinase
MMEHCLVLIKPDGVELSLTGEVITHLDREDLFLVGSKTVEVSRDLASSHYFEHREKSFFEDVVRYLTGMYHSFPWVYAFAYYGEDACSKIRSIVGRTNPLDTDAGKKIVTLRQKYGRNVIVLDEFGNERFDEHGHVLVRFENVLHASFSDMSEYEIKLWFKPEEILTHARLYPMVENDEGELEWLHPAEDVLRQRICCH